MTQSTQWQDIGGKFDDEARATMRTWPTRECEQCPECGRLLRLDPEDPEQYAACLPCDTFYEARECDECQNSADWSDGLCSECRGPYYPIARARCQLHRKSDGMVWAFTEFGCYTLIYITADGGVLCADCANGKHGSDATEDPRQEDRQWLLIGCQSYDEGPPMPCDHCGKLIESSYGDSETAAH